TEVQDVVAGARPYFRHALRIPHVRLADLDEPAVSGKDVVRGGNELVRQRVQDDVDALTAGVTQDFLPERRRAGIVDPLDAHSPKKLALPPAARGRVDLSARRLCELYGGHADAAGGGVDQHALTAPQTRQLVQRPVGGQERDRDG